MASSNQHIIYSAAAIKKYLAGKMSNEEMHAIEKAALDDPLLADAIEGYATNEKEDWQNVFIQLKNQIGEKEATPVISIQKTSAFKWWKAAAAVLLLGVTVTVAYLINGNKNDQNIASAEKVKALDSTGIRQKILSDSIDNNTVALNEPEKKERQEDDSFLSTDAAAAKDNTLIAEATPKKTPLNKQDDFIYKPSFKQAEASKSNEGIAQYDQATVSEDKQSAVQNAAPSVSNNANVETTENRAEKLPGQESNTEQIVKPLQRNVSGYNNSNKPVFYYTGKVKSNSGEPLAFASLKLSDHNKKNLTTDANGAFSIPATDSILNIEVASAGFSPRKFQLTPTANNNLVLQSSNAGLNEVTITSNLPKDKAKKRISNFDDEVEETAEPTGGWDSYNEYLNNNIHVPGNNRSPGTVEALVKVNKKGEVADVKITRSLNAECDKEAVRLIKKGPGWKVKQGKKGVGKVKVQFPQ